MSGGGAASPFTVDVNMDWSYAGGDNLMEEQSGKDLLHYALDQEGQTGPWEIAIRFVGDAEMCKLHLTFMGDPTPTDILTFPYDEDDGSQGGDIVISVDTAMRNASEAAWEARDELRFLMLHGLLHIVGWDDQEDAARSAMLARQHALLLGWELSGSS